MSLISAAWRQHAIVVPDKELILVFTRDMYGDLYGNVLSFKLLCEPQTMEFTDTSDIG